MKVFYRIIFMVFILNIPGFIQESGAWTEKVNFENGTVDGADGFSGFVGSGVYINTNLNYVQNGAYSVRVHFLAGDRCWDSSLTCGAHQSIETLGNGEELWIRAYYYFPPGFNWDSQGSDVWRKILRYMVSGAGNTGLMCIRESSSRCEIMGSTEASTYYSYNDQKTGQYLEAGNWYCIENYTKLSTSVEQTEHKIWINGTKIFDFGDFRSDDPTLPSPDSVVNTIRFFTYWNDAVSVTQNAYIDNIIITNELPAQQDTEGNPMIGPENGLILPKPNAAQNFRVE